jgi:hypothetical protein
MSARLSQTAERAIEAYGGAERWHAAEEIETTATFTGLLFWWKTRRPRAGARVRCSVQRPWTRLDPIDRRGRVGILDGQDVRLETSSGELIAERRAARSFFPGGRRYFHWDALDLTYFLGYATWNYLVLPALLLREDVDWIETEPSVLKASFPPELPTHSADQRYVFDSESGLLTRFDYKPVVATGDQEVWVANVVRERGEYEGIPYEARRTVYPVDDDTLEPRERFVMVDIRFTDWKLM